jgi:hypothetical protein
MLRCLTRSCCDDPTHITNRRDKKKFIRNMAARNRGRSSRTWVNGKRIKNFKVLSPNILLLTGADIQEQAASLNSLWDEDPVHLVPGKYEVLIIAIVERCAQENFTNSPGSKHPSQPNSNTMDRSIPTHHQRGRAAWVVNDDTLAYRDYDFDHRGRARGGRGHGGRTVPYKVPPSKNEPTFQT